MDWKEVGKKVAVAAPALGMAMAGPGARPVTVAARQTEPNISAMTKAVSAT